MVIRINAVFKKEKDVLEGKLIPYVSFFPLITDNSQKDVFGMKREGENAEKPISVDKFGPLLLLQEYTVLADRLLEPVSVLLDRRIKREFRTPIDAFEALPEQLRHPDADHTTTLHVKYVLSVERTSIRDDNILNRQPFVLNSVPVRTGSRRSERPAKIAAQKVLPSKTDPLVQALLVPNLTVYEEKIAYIHLQPTLAENELLAGEFTLKQISQTSWGHGRFYREKGLPVFGLNVNGFTDKFAPFLTTHRSTGGFYITALNMNFQGIDKPRKEFNESALNGFKVILYTGEVVMVRVKLLTVSADMMEANHMAGCKGPGASLPCKLCSLPKDDFNSEMFSRKEWERMLEDRTPAIVADQRKHLSTLTVGGKAFNDYLTVTGLDESESPLMKHISSLNPFLQCGVDASHSEQKGEFVAIGKRYADSC